MYLLIVLGAAMAILAIAILLSSFVLTTDKRSIDAAGVYDAVIQGPYQLTSYNDLVYPIFIKEKGLVVLWGKGVPQPMNIGDHIKVYCPEDIRSCTAVK